VATRSARRGRPPNVSAMVVDPDDGTLYVGTIGGGVTAIPAH
jgi:hypothetical protein